MNPVLAWNGASLTAKVITYAVASALLAYALWWAIGAPRVALASAERDLSTLQAQHEALKTKLAEAEAAVGDKTKAVQSAYDAGVKSAKDMRDKETTDAYNRGKTAGERIRAGTSSVRTVWRDRDCPASSEGSGPGAGEGTAGISGERADAIGRVLGQAGGWDAIYAEAYRRLEEAQKVVNACYEKPSR